VEAEREKREKILSLELSFLCVCDDFCQKFFSFVCATLFVQKSNVKREEEEENLIMSFFQEREKRDLVRFQIELFSIENVY
jgi:hypothetical protein